MLRLWLEEEALDKIMHRMINPI